MLETELKIAQLRAVLTARNLDGIWLRRSSNFAWLTGGAACYVNTATDTGAASLLVTHDAAYVITNNIEAPRLEHEEALAALDFHIMAAPWYQPNLAAEKLLGTLRLGADFPYPGATDVTTDLARLRRTLTEDEVARFRELGQACAAAMDEAIRGVRPGMTEFEIAGLLAETTTARGALPIVNLIATDERIFRFRHPLPTGKKLTRYAMLVLCGRRRGLVASVTRLLHFGPLPAAVSRKAEACALVDATLIARTRPGARLGAIFEAAVAAYAAGGYPDEWQMHHQGGPASYAPRDFLVTPDSAEIVTENQVYAWNPSIAGVKSEDTILVKDSHNEVLTAIEHWPTLQVEIDGQPILRPRILEMN